MTSSKPIQSLSLLRIEEEAPIAASFAGTLRAFGRMQQQEPSRARQSLTDPPAKSRTLNSTSPLRKGPGSNSSRNSPPADSPALAEQPSANRRASQSKYPQILARLWTWLQKQHTFSAKKQLRVSDTVSLGEKRFVALVHIEGQKFLIGGGSSGVSLLAELTNEAGLDSDLARDGEENSPILQPIACSGGRSR